MEENKFEELEHDDFNTELEKEHNKKNFKIYILLLLGTLFLGFLIYEYTENAKKSKVVEEVVVSRSVVKKSFERKPIIPIVKEEKPLPSPLPLLPTATKEKILKPKIIKSNSSSIIKFDTFKTNNQTDSSIDNSTSTKMKFSKNEIPYKGGISNVAGIHHFDPNLSLSRGTYIGCSLQTRIVSAVGGEIACTVTSDVYSSSGNVLLVEKGSKVVGKYKSAKLRYGLDRLYVIWDEIRTPNNIVVNVSSGASDELGGQGIHGTVDYNWGLRIGSALLVSLIDDSISAAAAKASDGRTNYLIETGRTGEDISEKVLNRFINIPPVLYKNHGDVVAIFVNKDIDFSKVYKLTR